MGVQVTNNAFSTLAGSINTVVTALSVQSGHGARFPAASVVSGNYFYITLLDAANNLEIVKVTDRTVDVFTIVRARDGTTAKVFTANDRIELRPVAALFNELPNRLLVNADLTDNTIETIKLKTIAGLAPGTFGGAFKRLTATVNSKGQITALTESADALNVYTEGTFTPVLAFGGASVGLTYTTQAGHYTRIGRLVTGSIHIVVGVNGTSIGSATISGLPFTANASSVSGGAVSVLGMSTLVDGVRFQMIGAVAVLGLFNGAATGNVALTEGNVPNGATMILNFSYFV